MQGGYYSTVPTYRKGRTHERIGPDDRGGCAGVLSVLMVLCMLVAPPIVLWISERSHYETFTTLQEMVQKGVTPFSSKSIPGDIVHLTTPVDNDKGTSGVTTSDPAMGITVKGALSIERQVEYCQWEEFRHKRCDTCTRTVEAKDGSTSEETYDCNCITEYSYVKSWVPHLVPSFMFDQPGAHHNPQRNPLPPSKFFIDEPLEVTVTEGKADSDMSTSLQSKVLLPPSLFHNLQLPKRNINWVKGGIPKKPGFFGRLFSWGVDTTRYDPLVELKGTESSEAALEHNFVYVGQGGYFFSPYESSRFNKLMNLFVQYMEGSLFDWQIGDLMPSCTAGDIRIHYKVQDPSEISVLAQVAQRREVRSGATNTVDQEVGLQLSMYQSDQTTKKIALIQEGDRTVSEMIHAAVVASSRSTWIFRAILIIWSVAVAKFLFGAYGGYDLDRSSWAFYVSAIVSVLSASLAAVWTVTWGINSEFARMDIMIAVVSCAFTSIAVVRNVPKRSVPGGLNAVWCMIGRWAKVPPSWRQETTYLMKEDEAVPPPSIPTKEKTKNF